MHDENQNTLTESERNAVIAEICALYEQLTEENKMLFRIAVASLEQKEKAGGRE